MTFSTTGMRERLERAAEGNGYELHPPLSEDEVASFERQHGVVLPADYRRFLVEVASGFVTDCVMFTPFSYAKEEISGLLSTPFPYSSAYAARLRELASAGGSFIDKLRAHGLWDEQVDGMPSGCIVLGDYACGEQSLLVVTGEERGCIWRTGDVDSPETMGGYRGDNDASPVDFASWLDGWFKEHGIE